MQRTPPNVFPRDLAHSQTQSDPNLLASMLEDRSRNVSTRQTKRPRPDTSEETSESHVDNLQIKDLKDLILSFQSEQSSILKTLVNDVNEIKSSKQAQTELLNKLVSEINEMKQQNCLITKKNEDLGATVEFLSAGFETINSQIETLEKEKAEYINKIERLENELQDSKRSSRPSTVEIKNLPEDKAESPEQLKAAIMKLAKTVNVDIHPSDIRDLYRLPSKQGSSRPVVVEFSSVTLKKTLLNGSRVFNKARPTNEKLNTTHLNAKGEIKPIYVSEYLPGSNRKIFYFAKEFAKNHHYKYCWIKDGRILLQKHEKSKVIQVLGEDSLQSLKKQE